ncbi:hypothetical protein ACFCXK_31925 [Streptomyces sp. NPDC056269]|uniref:hypothetical protein n=1 Tax=Streptomyces sp. NPDC056269 TaxID=3345768 RepID=UPI0035DF21C3
MEALTDLNTESVRTEPYTAEDPGRQGQVRGASASDISNSGAFVGDYIGESTRSEIDYARANGKPIRYTHPEVDPYGDALPVVNCEIHLTDGASRTLSCVEPVPGLHVFQMPEDLLGEGENAAFPWRLSHCSGRGLAAFPTQDDALRGAREVADLNDWTRTPGKLSTDASFDLDEYIDRLLHRTNGMLIPQSAKGANL